MIIPNAQFSSVIQLNGAQKKSTHTQGPAIVENNIIKGVIFKDCAFKSITFNNCRFINCSFVKGDIDHCIFKNCKIDGVSWETLNITNTF